MKQNLFVLIFRSKLAIQSNNEQFRKGEVTYELGFTSLSDVPKAEFEKMKGFSGKRPPKVIIKEHLKQYVPQPLPKYVNWIGIK